MGRDITYYEGDHPARIATSSHIALGKIMSVNIKKRTCTVATVTGHVGGTFDGFHTDVQWLCADANPDGDEFGSIPRRGSWGVVYFMDSQVFIGNYMRPTAKGGTVARSDDKVTMNEGDKVISTLAGNRFTVKRSGLMEIQANDVLKILLIPTNNQLGLQCGFYNLQADGGFVDWRSFGRLQNTVWRAEYYTNVSKAFVLAENRGHISDELVFSRTIGSGLPGINGIPFPVYSQTIGITGETITTVSPPVQSGAPFGYKSTIGPDGSISIVAASGQTWKFDVDAFGHTQLEVNSLVTTLWSKDGDFGVKGPLGEFVLDKTGLINLKNAAASVTVSKDGDVDVKGPVASLSMTKVGGVTITNGKVNVTISAAGEVTIDAPQKVTMTAKAGVDIKSAGEVTVEGTAGVNVKSTGPIKLSGMGQEASDYVLTNPTTLSPFTGAPLMPFSNSIMVSK